MDVKFIDREGLPDPVRKAKATKLRESRALRLGDEAKALGRNMAGWMEGDAFASARLKESISTGDFPTLFNRLVDQGMLAQYAELPSVWQAFSSRVVVPDFRQQRLMQWVPTGANRPVQNGGKVGHPLALPRVPELTEYPTFSLEEQGEQYGVAKYGERFPFSWEVWRNDEFQVIQDMPGVMSRTAVDTEDILTTQVLAGPTGPNPDFFNGTWDFGPQVPAGNILEGNPALSVDALEDAIENVGMRQVNGRPVTVRSWTLIVPPALEFTARRIAAIASYEQVEGDPTAPGGQRRYILPNLVAGRFTVLVNPWLPLVDTSETSATTWYLVPTGGTDGVRRAIITAFLAGEETPDLRISNNQGAAIGGGAVDPYRGSFSHDDVQFRVRHVLAAAGVNPAPVVASNGTGDDS